MGLSTFTRPGRNIGYFVLPAAGLVLVIGLMLGALVICARLTAPQSTVLTSTACPAPCWYGLRPGASRADDVLSVLNQQPFVKPDSVRTWPASGPVSQIAWSFQRPSGDEAGYAYFASDQCTAISIMTVGSLTVADALGKFGQPQLLFTQLGTADLAGWVEVDLLYPAAGYIVEADLSAPAKGDPPQVTVGQRTPVVRVTYFDPPQFQALLAGGTLLTGQTGLSQSDLRPWPGLGPVDFARP